MSRTKKRKKKVKTVEEKLKALKTDDSVIINNDIKPNNPKLEINKGFSKLKMFGIKGPQRVFRNKKESGKR